MSENGGELWAITSYFNPVGYQRRLANYKVFREYLKLPLVAVELAYGAQFELVGADAELLVQLRGKDILWQKERLLNTALKSLPGSCRKVVWVDCDVVFKTDDWAAHTSRLLDCLTLVQPFAHIYYARKDWSPGDDCQPGEMHHSIPFLVATGVPAPACLRARSIEQFNPAPGFAWAARRELLDAVCLYDACIVGGGDGVIARAAYGCFMEAVERHSMGAQFSQHYLAWAHRFYNAVRGRIGFVEGDLLHLWHGKPTNRKYANRNEGIVGFDPFVDIALTDDGTWRWNSIKPEMHEFVRRYFAERMEDG